LYTCGDSSYERQRLAASTIREVSLRNVQIITRHADPRTTTIDDRRRQHFDRRAAYIVVAFVIGGWVVGQFGSR
jgi:hypothetical protein